jgi:FMN phosphatase YigB (HAD superfamily)
MTEQPYPTVLFDWGDTVMYDDPALTLPMAEWAEVHPIEGVADMLADLHVSGRQIILATGAMVSDEGQIRAALDRAGLNAYFSRVYCFKNTNLPKGEAFYRYILGHLDVPASDVLMVGDSFEKDVRIPNTLGIFGVWFNQRSAEKSNNELHTTVHSMQDLRAFFRALRK